MKSLLCVHAHPDDEALFTGGLLARHHDLGHRTGVVTCTYTDGDPRISELAKSLDILGAGAPRLLGYQDADRASDNAFVDAPFDEAVGRLVAHLRAFRPDVVVTYDAFGAYGHPDHIRAHQITLAAVEACGFGPQYPEAGDPWWPSTVYQVTFPRSLVLDAWAEFADGEVPDEFGMPDERVGLTLDVRPWLDRKWDAVRGHESAVGRGARAAWLMPLREQRRAQLLGTEHYLVRHLSQ